MPDKVWYQHDMGMCAILSHHFVLCSAQGEGDSRWLVTDRADGQNVGAWHWEEVNKMKWSRQRLTELLVGIETELDPSIGHAALRELKDLQGEVNTPGGCAHWVLE